MTFAPAATRRGEPPLLASLPMYDFPEVRDATDALWSAISARLSARGVDAPPALLRGRGRLEALWTSPRLLLSQTCGYPLVTRLQECVQVIGTPCYAAEGCDGPRHRSAIVVARRARATSLADLRSPRCAVNDVQSNTGMNLLRAEIAALAGGAPFFSEVQVTGSHAASLGSVAAGHADVAAIDAVTLALLQRLRPALTEGVRVLHWTAPSPGLPLIASSRRSEQTHAALRGALFEIGADPRLRDVRRELLWDGFASLRLADYRPVLGFVRQAAEVGYPELV